tara:strand:- start:168 stop:1256 length:1089 start_codon:yes stop_codon:yes gene_type:complete
MKTNLIEKFYKNKNVLIIGHTGFKGSWLSICLKDLGAKVFGISRDIPTNPSHFQLLNFKEQINDYRFDIRDYKRLKKSILSIKPDIIFHLAAQSLVKESFRDPYTTWTTNLMGTINLLEILKYIKIEKKMSVVVITSDKCYKNLNNNKRYKESDVLGDDEPYGASKAAAELAFRSYFASFLSKKKNLRIATARAGNVIGGGDWSKDRIIPDLIRSIKRKKTLKIRYPNSTRPWQHVLEPIYGYLFLAQNLFVKEKNNGESFNFGPKFIKNYKVITLLKEFKKYLPHIKWKKEFNIIKIHEAGLLNLNSNKSFKNLKWKNILNFKETIRMTAEWYLLYFNNHNVKKITFNQINSYKKKLNRQN